MRKNECENNEYVYDLRSKNDKVVVQKRTKNWTGLVFPGAHVEKNESITESVIREVKEETGLIVNDLVLCGVKDYFYNQLEVVLCYKTTNYIGELSPQVGEDEVFWIRLDELNENNTPSGFLDMLKLFTTDSQELYCDTNSQAYRLY